MDVNTFWGKQNSFLTDYQNLSIPVGTMTLIEFNELYAMIVQNYYLTNHKRAKIQIADLGCWTGRTTCFFGEIAKELDGRVTSIDDFSGRDSLCGAAFLFNIQNIWNRNISLSGLEQYVSLKVGDVCNIAELFKDDSLDVVFIDVSRKYGEMKQTLDAWHPKLKHRGLMCGCDADVLLNYNFKSKFKDKPQDYFLNHFVGIDVAVPEKNASAKRTHSGSIWYYTK